MLASYLRGHPDPSLVKYILTGLSTGFDLGFNGTLVHVHRNNNKSARDNPDKVSSAIQKELSRGHTAGPCCGRGDHSVWRFLGPGPTQRAGAAIGTGPGGVH